MEKMPLESVTSLQLYYTFCIDGQSLSHYKWRKLINSRNIWQLFVYPTINWRILDGYGVWLQQMSCTQFGGLKLFHVHAMILLKWLSDDICIESLDLLLYMW